ncbi:MAG: ribonuclease H family protein, partial [Bacteroidales bacterium]|nr:ribonuclease H family protein [Bacteroidales bacterium]
YESWEECKKQIEGFAGAVYKSFTSREMAEKAYSGNARDFLKTDARKLEFENDPELVRLAGRPVLESLSVDAACSGNPGKMEYRGVYTRNGRELFRSRVYPKGTINIGEFLALVHALGYLHNKGSHIPIYSDSRNAIKWVREKNIKTKLARDNETEHLFTMVDRALAWLKDHDCDNEILKWKTEYWGEIPADFGRK